MHYCSSSSPSWREEEFEAQSGGHFLEICASKLNLNDHSLSDTCNFMAIKKINMVVIKSLLETTRFRQ